MRNRFISRSLGAPRGPWMFPTTGVTRLSVWRWNALRKSVDHTLTERSHTQTPMRNWHQSLEEYIWKRDQGTCTFSPDSATVVKSSTSALDLPPVRYLRGWAACSSSVTPAGWTGPCSQWWCPSFVPHLAPLGCSYQSPPPRWRCPRFPVAPEKCKMLSGQGTRRHGVPSPPAPCHLHWLDSPPWPLTSLQQFLKDGVKT